MSAAASNDDFAGMIQEAVQKALTQQAVQTESPAKIEKKSKKGPKIELDNTRTMGSQSQDPRADPNFWPCKGKHSPKQFSNRYGAWQECQTCALRMAYTPAKGASGQSVHMDLPANVVSAMEHLRMEGFAEEDVTSRLVKKTISFIVSQEHIKTKKAEKGKKEQKTIPNGTVPEVHNLASDDEGPIKETKKRADLDEEESMIWENHQASSWNEGRGDDEMRDEMNEPTPNLILRELTENLNSSIFHIEQQLRSLQERQFNLWELWCSPSSTLSGVAIRNGLKARRWTFEEGFDIEKPECVQEAISALKTDVPSKIWASLRCTPWTSNHDMSQRTPQQVANLRRMKLRARKQLRHVLKIFKTALSQDTGTDIYFEWPKYASEGWRLPELKEFEHWYNTTFEKPLYRTEIHGYMVGLVDGESKRIHKPWIILSTDQHFDCHAAVVFLE